MKQLTHGLFLRWWLLMSLVTVSFFIANHFNIFQIIWTQDATKLSFVIMAGAMIVSLWCGYSTFAISKILCNESYYDTKSEQKISKIIENEEIGWFASQMCLNVGMIGTVLGFILMLVGFASVDVANIKSVQDLLGNMSSGMSTALYTTLTGLICMQLLQLQFFNLARALKTFKEEQ